VPPQSAPTWFGAVDYRIVSDVDHGRITATIEMPNRRTPKSLYLRLRHPQAAAIKSVTVNGRPWTDFRADREWIELKGLSGKVVITAGY
jgi:hypothetical protein